LPLPKPDLSVKLKDHDFNIEAPLVTVRRAALKLVLAGSAIFLGYEAYSLATRTGWLHHKHVSFWKRVLLSSVAKLSVAVDLGLYLAKALGGNYKAPYSYIAHSKPSVTIAKPITEAFGFLKLE
jgi:hypothetical protein